MNRFFAKNKGLLLVLFLGVSAYAHVTPMVVVTSRAEFIRYSLRRATHFFIREIDSHSEIFESRHLHTWHPRKSDIHLYVGRDTGQHLVGAVVFLRIPSRHGPVEIGVAYDTEGTILNAAVTQVGSEPLTFLTPMLSHGFIKQFDGDTYAAKFSTRKLAPKDKTPLTQYYARVIVAGMKWTGRIFRAEILDQSRSEIHP